MLSWITASSVMAKIWGTNPVTSIELSDKTPLQSCRTTASVLGFRCPCLMRSANRLASCLPIAGHKVRDRCPISWWDIDMPPEDWVKEAEESIKRGYTSIKLKARPWRDIFEQGGSRWKSCPRRLQIGHRLQRFLRTAEGAQPVLQELDKHPNVAYYESPYYLGTDIEGAGRLQEAVEKRIVEHFNESCLHARCCGGFVVGGGATGTRTINALCASFDKPFWLQMVGTGLRPPTPCTSARFCLMHSCQQSPALSWEHDLLTQRLEVVDGTIAPPEAPGLGVEVDEYALERYPR